MRPCRGDALDFFLCSTDPQHEMRLTRIRLRRLRCDGNSYLVLVLLHTQHLLRDCAVIRASAQHKMVG